MTAPAASTREPPTRAARRPARPGGCAGARTRVLRASWLAGLAAVALGCAAGSEPAPPRHAQPSPHAGPAPTDAGAPPHAARRGAADASHPLADRIWDVRTQAFVDAPTLVQQLARRRYVLLGEVHDNPVQHRIQADLLRALVRAGRRPAVVFEMIPRDRAAALAEALSAPSPQAVDVRRAVAWDASGWPDFAIYAPIFDAALEAGLPLRAGDLTQEERLALRRQGIAGLGTAEAAALGLDTAPDARAQATLEAAIREGHCDLLPASALPRLVEFQRARDATLARALREAAAGADGAVLVTGAGHARRDVAVPAWLARDAPEPALASLALIEVEEGRTDPQRLLAKRFGGNAPFDYVWFTPRAPREDPCEALRQHLAQPHGR